MRSTKVPAADPPLVDHPVTSPGGRASGGQAAGVMAKLSLCAGMCAFLLNGFSASDRFHLSPGARLVILVVCTVFILIGCALAVFAARAHARNKRPGVVGFVLAAVLGNGLLLALLTYGVIRILIYRNT